MGWLFAIAGDFVVASVVFVCVVVVCGFGDSMVLVWVLLFVG